MCSEEQKSEKVKTSCMYIAYWQFVIILLVRVEDRWRNITRVNIEKHDWETCVFVNKYY